MTSKTAQQKTLNKTNQTNIKTNTKTNIKTKTNQTTKIKTNTETKKNQTNIKTKTNTKFAGNPDYEFDTIKKRWVKKSDIRPIELVNKYKLFLEDYLQKNTNLDHKKIRDIVKKHATSTERLKELLVKEGLEYIKVINFFNGISFWNKELCGHMEKKCPVDTDLYGNMWCKHDENNFLFVKDEKNKISCYSIDDIYSIISSSFTGGDKDAIFLQLPRDPYTRKIFNEDFIKKFLKQLRLNKELVNQKNYPHVAYFLKNYKKLYNNTDIKLFLKKNILTTKEKWELSEIIEDFLYDTDEIHPGIAKSKKIFWFWNDKNKEPANLYEYIFKK